MHGLTGITLRQGVLKLDIIAQMKEGGPKELFYVTKDSKLLLSPNT